MRIITDYYDYLNDSLYNILNYMKNKRWYGDKSLNEKSMEIYDYINMDDFVILILKINFDDKHSLYYLPLFLSELESDNKITHFNINGKKINVYDAFYFKEFAEFIVKNIENSKNNSKIEFIKTKFFYKNDSNGFKTINSEQSNSSFIINSMIIKNYRYLQYGNNPDIFMALKLNEYNFYSVPKIYGYMLYKNGNKTICLANAMQYLDNSIDLWSYYVNYLKDNKNFEDEIIKLADNISYITGNMAYNLSKISEPDFIPEAMNIDDMLYIIDNIDKYIEKSLKYMDGQNIGYNNILRDVDYNNIKSITFNIFKNNKIMKTRVHGDYHLGQILLYKNNYYIIDFEGEPVKTIEERNKKLSPLKDAAGIIRSIDYLIGYFNINDYNLFNTVKSRFMDNYIRIVSKSNIFNIDADDLLKLLDIFLLEKASYELYYEINNRPSWIKIPLNFIENTLKNYIK